MLCMNCAQSFIPCCIAEANIHINKLYSYFLCQNVVTNQRSEEYILFLGFCQTLIQKDSILLNVSRHNNVNNLTEAVVFVVQYVCNKTQITT